jgi:hypothetical protein
MASHFAVGFGGRVGQNAFLTIRVDPEIFVIIFPFYLRKT